MFEAIFSFSTLWWIMLILYVPTCLALIAVVLLQKGKGVGFAGAFGMGGGGSETVFGPRATRSLPVRLTHTAAAVFMILALGMTLVAGHAGRGAAPEAVTPEELQPTLMDLDELEGQAGASLPAPDAAPAEAEAEDAAAAPEGETPAVTVTDELAVEPPAGEAGGEAPSVSVDADLDAPAPVESEEAPAGEAQPQ